MEPLFSIEFAIVLAVVIALGLVMNVLARRPGRAGYKELNSLLQSAKVEKRPRQADIRRHSIFISYRRADSADIVGRLYEHLSTYYGEKAIFKDVEAIDTGDDFRQILQHSLAECQVFLCVMGKHWVGPIDATGQRLIDRTSDYVRIEVESALSRDVLVIPLLVHGVAMPSEDQLPNTVRDLVFRQGQPLRSDPDFKSDLQKLHTRINKHLGV